MRAQTQKKQLWLITSLLLITTLISACASAEGTTQAEMDPVEVNGIPVGFTEEGYPYRGQLDAPVALVEYSDYLCPFCERHFNQTMPTIEEDYIKTGKVVHIFRDYPIQSLHPTAPVGHQAALCVAEQGAEKFWQMHNLLFKNQNQWNQFPDPSTYLSETAKSVGVEMDDYEECVVSGRTSLLLQQSVSAAQELGYNGTPSFQVVNRTTDKQYELIGAYPYETFAGWFDALLAGEEPPEEEIAEESEEESTLPGWALPEGLAPNPERPGFTMAGDAYIGDPEAPMAMVVFSDFQCDACQKFAQETFPAVLDAYIDNGKVLFVFKNLPLKENPQAPAAAAVAAECAGEQGKFWEMHDLLFSDIEAWAVENPDQQLIKLAEEIDLDADSFQACLSSRQALERVLSDIYDAEGIAAQTPTFIGLYNNRGQLVRGTVPQDDFLGILEKMYSEATEGES